MVCTNGKKLLQLSDCQAVYTSCLYQLRYLTGIEPENGCAIVDENGVDTAEPIVFSEWAFITGTQMQRKDYTLDELVNGKPTSRPSPTDDGQMVLFGDEKEVPDPEGKFLAQYVTHYRRLGENDTV